MIEKLSIEQFRQIKSQQKQIIQKYEQGQDIDEEEMIEQYIRLQNQLLNYDLSDIPFEEWQDMALISEEELDLSKTHANIDFNIVDYEASHGNFKGCNVKNLDKISSQLATTEFDEETIKRNSSLFLSDNYTKEFKQKFYMYSLTITDLQDLSTEQLEELKQKNYINHMGNEGYLINLIGEEKAVQLYNYSKEEYNAVNDMYMYMHNIIFEDQQLADQIKNTDVSDIKKVYFDFIKQQIISNYAYRIKLKDFPRLFINENPDIFLTKVNIPDEVKERYFSRNLKVQDLIDYPDVFKSIPIDNFLSIGQMSPIQKFFEENYGLGKFQEVVINHPDVFKYLIDNNKDYDFSDFLKVGKDLESTFTQAVKEYIIANNIYSIANTEEKISYNIPEWLSSMNFTFIDRINSIEELSQCTPSTVILDSHQRYTIDSLGIENIKKIEEETGLFSNIDSFNYLCTYIGTYNISEDGVNFKNGSLNYDEFSTEFAKIINRLRKNGQLHILGYDWIQGKFKDKHPELFLSDDAPQELKKAFYEAKINVKYLLSQPQYIEYLRKIDLEVLFNYMPISVTDNEESQLNLTAIIKEKFGQEDGFDIMLRYGQYIEKAYTSGMLQSFTYNPNNQNFTKEDLLNEIDKIIKQYIIEKNAPYDQNIHDHFKQKYPELFLSNDAPQELKKEFYEANININYILSHPQYIEYLRKIDLEVLFNYMPISVADNEESQLNLTAIIKEKFGQEDGFDIMLRYGQYIETAYEINKFEDLKLQPNFTKEDLLNELDKYIYKSIVENGMKYDENMPNNFKNKNPTLFLSQSFSEKFRDKFYNKEFTLNDFNENPELLEMFGNTNVAAGFPKNVSWIIPMFDNLNDKKGANYNRLKVISEYNKIQDVALQKNLKEYVMESSNNIDIKKIEYVSSILSRLLLSNSSEVFAFRNELATQLLKSDKPIENLNKIEDIFIRNNIPTVGKIYSCFEILHPDLQGFDFENSEISPILKKSSMTAKKMIIFSDLIKSSFGSNNKSVNTYLKNIELGSNLYESIKSGKIQYDALSEADQKELLTFSKHLMTLYNNTLKGKKEQATFTPTGNILTDIHKKAKKLSPNDTLDYNLADRVIRMFCGFTGINTLEEAKEYINQKTHTADIRNREASTSDMILEQGDFIKGIGEITYLRNILQNGSVSREYLGASADSDSTPLDTDVSMIMKSEGTIRDKMEATAASGYGPIWFVLKNDDRFMTTRTNMETLNIKNDMSKLEVFYTGAAGKDHYGIRTGFASSEINYIVMNSYE